MRLLSFLADAFINTFGITKPTEKARRQETFFILTLMVAALAAAAAARFAVHSLLH